jgi:2-polyprenyl-3-methyl-5-hydroxy-6-metoxy-1,4-benzoquinol methylase
MQEFLKLAAETVGLVSSSRALATRTTSVSISKHPADIVGDILEWKRIGLQPESFDVIIAFELVEHVDCFQEFFDLLSQAAY